MSLTEMYKNGELPSKDENHEWLAYYIKHKDGLIHADSYCGVYWGTASPDSIEEVLDTVPSYEELQSMKEQLNKEGTWYTEISYKKLEKEIKHLKDLQANQDKEVESLRELLKECKRGFEKVERNYGYDDSVIDIFDPLLFRINAAIGESEEL